MRCLPVLKPVGGGGGAYVEWVYTQANCWGVVVVVLLWSGDTRKQTHNLLCLVDRARVRNKSRS